MEEESSRIVSAIVIGCGQRGKNYASYAEEYPQRLKIVAVADPVEHRRQKLAQVYGINSQLVVDDWRKLADKEKMADCAFICTQDQMHRDPAVALASKGYHLLLEKPMAVDEKECEEIAEACQRNGVILTVCHVLRYFPPVLKIKEIIDKGLIGEVVTIDHRENILWWHFAHSFVRGNWRNVATSTFSLLAKSCHDIDLIMAWMGDRKCTKIHSFGGLKHFKLTQAPKESGMTCFECPQTIERACPYSAKKVYLERFPTDEPHWPMSVVCDIEDDPRGYKSALTDALKSGPYSRCIYKCDNDVVDHQVVNMEFENGATASFTMNAFTKDMRRETRICGTKGELRWDGSTFGPIICYDFAKDEEYQIFPDKNPQLSQTSLKGHGGADFCLIDTFVKAIGKNDPSLVLTGIKDSLRSHKLVFAAERSRLNGSIESIDI